jgi:hypothetical protein
MMTDDPIDIHKERRMIEPRHEADVIDAASKFRQMPPLRDTSDPGLLAISKLPLQAGLATRVRTMIEAGSTDQAIDIYIEAWIESASGEPNRKLHRDLDAIRRGPRPECD